MLYFDWRRYRLILAINWIFLDVYMGDELYEGRGWDIVSVVKNLPLDKEEGVKLGLGIKYIYVMRFNMVILICMIMEHYTGWSKTCAPLGRRSGMTKCLSDQSGKKYGLYWEQKLGSGVTKLKKWYFHLFLSNLSRNARQKQRKFTEILVQVRNIGLVSSLVSVLPTQGVFST